MYFIINMKMEIIAFIENDIVYDFFKTYPNLEVTFHQKVRLVKLVPTN